MAMYSYNIIDTKLWEKIYQFKLLLLFTIHNSHDKINNVKAILILHKIII